MKHMLGGVLRPRHDETLYSMVSRLSRYWSLPTPEIVHRGFFGSSIPLIDDLPVGMADIVFTGGFGKVDVDHAIHEWTQFPYYARYVSPACAAGTIRAMTSTGTWPHALLASWSHSLPPPDRLRFCVSCITDMLERHADPWWQRSHQLPSVLVCPDHGEVLREANVTRAVRRKLYVAADEAKCSERGSQAVVVCDERTRLDLLLIARASDEILDSRCDEHPDDRRERYLQRLNAIGFLTRKGEANLARIAKAMDSYWGDTLSVWPGLTSAGKCAQGWLGRLLLGQHRSPPLHHLFLEWLLIAHDV